MTEGLPALFLKRFKETEITSLVIVICCCAIANLSSLEDPVRFANFQGGPTWSMACGLWPCCAKAACTGTIHGCQPSKFGSAPGDELRAQCVMHISRIVLSGDFLSSPFQTWDLPSSQRRYFLKSPRCNCPGGHEELGCQDSTDTSSFLHSFTSMLACKCPLQELDIAVV